MPDRTQTLSVVEQLRGRLKQISTFMGWDRPDAWKVVEAKRIADTALALSQPEHQGDEELPDAIRQLFEAITPYDGSEGDLHMAAALAPHAYAAFKAAQPPAPALSDEERALVRDLATRIEEGMPELLPEARKLRNLASQEHQGEETVERFVITQTPTGPATYKDGAGPWVRFSDIAALLSQERQRVIALEEIASPQEADRLLRKARAEREELREALRDELCRQPPAGEVERLRELAVTCIESTGSAAAAKARDELSQSLLSDAALRAFDAALGPIYNDDDMPAVPDYRRAQEAALEIAKQGPPPSDSQGDQERLCGRCEGERFVQYGLIGRKPCPDCNGDQERPERYDAAKEEWVSVCDPADHIWNEGDAGAVYCDNCAGYFCWACEGRGVKDGKGCSQCSQWGIEWFLESEDRRISPTNWPRNEDSEGNPAPTQVEGDAELSAVFADIDLDLRPEAVRQADPDAYAKACKLRRQPEGGDEEGWPERRFEIQQDGWAVGGDPGPLYSVMQISGPPLTEQREFGEAHDQGPRIVVVPATSQDSSGLLEAARLAHEEEVRLTAAAECRASKAEAERERAFDQVGDLAARITLTEERNENALEESAEELDAQVAVLESQKRGNYRDGRLSAYRAAAKRLREKAAKLKEGGNDEAA